jgi:putative zinc finger/helix-turn-helix YgiT family protein
MDQPNLILLPNAELRVCDQCGQEAVRLHFETQTFPYGEGEDQTILQARVPIWTCQACGEQYTEAAAEETRHDAICKHLGRLTPSEVRNIREVHGKSQQEWAKLTGFGPASVKRWETGNQIQNEAADRYLRLLSDPVVYGKVALLERGGPEDRDYRFQTKLPNATYERAHAFQLRRESGRA